MKKQKLLMTGILAAGGLLLAGALQLQAQNLIIYSSALNTGGTQGGEANRQVEYPVHPGDGSADFDGTYGGGTLTWDSTETDPATDGGGSIYVNAPFYNGVGGGKPMLCTVGFGYDNWYYNGNGTVDFSMYNGIQFDVLWDTAHSQLNIDQFNTLDQWPLADLPGWNSDPNYLQEQGCTAGIEIDEMVGSGGSFPYLVNFNIPDSAASGWQHVVVHYSPGIAGPGAGLAFQKWVSATWAITGTVTCNFWLDNIQLLPAPSGPPTMASITPTIPGLNIFNGSLGNSYYDRNQVASTTSAGLSWAGSVGSPNSSFPVSYSFDMEGFPNGTNIAGEEYMLLIPNQGAANANGPDWGDAACFYFQANSTKTGNGAARTGSATLSYKTSQYNVEPNKYVTWTGWSGPSAGAAGTNNVPSQTLFGNYTLTFTGLDSGTVTVPDGTVGSFTLPAGTGATYFAEGVTESQGSTNQPNTVPFQIYLGGQANQAPAMNQPLVYASFTASGIPSASSVTENFVADANQPTPALVNWTTAASSHPVSDVLVPSSALYWVAWDLPANGYALVNTKSLTSPHWTTATTYNPFSLYQESAQIIVAADMQTPTNVEYFGLIQRTYTQMVVVLPGQTFTTGVGVSGAPTALTGGNWVESATVYAVDASYNVVTSQNLDSVTLTSATDASFSAPAAAATFVNGVASFTGANAFSFGTAGSETVTATDGAAALDRKSVV